MARVDFEVTPGDGVQGYWIAVGTEDVPLNNGSGSLDLPPGRHLLVWWFVGNPGNSISIVGQQGGRTVVEVKESQIPDGEHQGAGTRRFDT